MDLYKCIRQESPVGKRKTRQKSICWAFPRRAAPVSGAYPIPTRPPLGSGLDERHRYRCRCPDIETTGNRVASEKLSAGPHPRPELSVL